MDNDICTIINIPYNKFNPDNEYVYRHKLIDNKCSVALATDFNPGTCTIRSLAKIMLLSVFMLNNI